MTDETNDGVTLTPEEMEQAAEFCECLAANYRNNGDRRTSMPWTCDHFTEDELRQWLASRKQVGKEIDIATCEIGRWYANVLDEYGIREALNEPLSEEEIQSGGCWFVRSSQSDGWVSMYDLPPEKSRALDARIGRQRLH